MNCDKMNRVILHVLVLVVLLTASFLVPYLWQRVAITTGIIINALYAVKHMRSVLDETDGE